MLRASQTTPARRACHRRTGQHPCAPRRSTLRAAQNTGTYRHNSTRLAQRAHHQA
ncbi:hypothetical protein A2U01_0105837, partial [Trifolium medium]|nr:hypothetical protein [Trifolium medium]